MIGHWPGSSKVALNSWRTLEDWLQPQANDYSLALDRDARARDGVCFGEAKRSPDFFLLKPLGFPTMALERILKVRKKSGNRERCRKLSL